MPLLRFPSFPQSILTTVLNDDFGKARHNEGNANRHSERQRRIYACGEEDGKASSAQ